MSVATEKSAQPTADSFHLSAILEPLVRERVDACMDAYVTKDYLKAVVTTTENRLLEKISDVRKEVTDFRKEVHKEITDVREAIGSVNGNIAEMYVKLSDKINKTSYTLLFAAAALLAVFSTLPGAIKELVQAISKTAGG